MIEMSFGEVFLIVWGSVATIAALKYKEDAHMHKYIIHKILSDAKLREDMVAGYKKFNSELTQ
jgi:hypothetical protein